MRWLRIFGSQRPARSSGTERPDQKLRFRPMLESLEDRTLLATGVIGEFAVPTAASLPGQIAADHDGNMYFIETAVVANKIGKVSNTGVITEVVVPTAAAFNSDSGITVGGDGFVYFSETVANKI